MNLQRIINLLFSKQKQIEHWFADKSREISTPITSSVDLRLNDFKIAPVDTNLFPAGFNNLNLRAHNLCSKAFKNALLKRVPSSQNIILIPEAHTRNKFYSQNIYILREIIEEAGFKVKIGHLDLNNRTRQEVVTLKDNRFIIYPISLNNKKIAIEDFIPDCILLNNDLSDPIPDYLTKLSQPIFPAWQLGWHQRLKHQHFINYNKIATLFANFCDFDPWLIDTYIDWLDDIEFMSFKNFDKLALHCDNLIKKIEQKYSQYNIHQQPFLAIKSDNGTYGMSVIMVHSGQQILDLNRKQRTKMSASKGSHKVTKVLLQEGVYTTEKLTQNGFSEPVIYMIGDDVVGGFHRIHEGKLDTQNLNTPGMYFKSFDFLTFLDNPKYYTQSVIARLAGLAAGLEGKS